MIELRTLGAFDIRDAAGASMGSVTSQSKRSALLLYLTLARPRGAHRRDTLLGLFWPDASEERARGALNQAVYVLRQRLGDDVLVTEGEAIRVNPERVRCDAIELADALERDDPAAAELYTGTLLPGFFVPNAPEFDRWLETERGRLREGAAAAATARAEALRASGNPAGAATWLRRAAEWNPFDERVVRLLLRSLAEAGDRAGALAAYEAFVARLSVELEVEPEAETRALAARLRASGTGPQRVATAAAEPLAAGPVGAAPASVAPRAPTGVVATTELGSDGVVEAPAAQPSLPGHADGGRFRWSPGGLAAGMVVVLVAVAAVAAPLARRPEPPPELETAGGDPGRRVLVLPLVNRVGDPALEPFGPMAGDWITQGLAATGLVEVIPYSSLRRWPAESPSLVREMRHETGAGLVVEGSFIRQDERMVVHARILDGPTGRVLRALEIDGGATRDPVALAERVRGRVTGALATLLDPRLSEWADAASQPPSFEAYRAYVDGMDLFFERTPETYRAAADRFRDAATIDSSFTAPLLWAIQAHGNGGEWDEARALAASLAPRRSALPPWDRSMLDYLVADLAPDPEASYHAARRLVDLVPTSEWRMKLAAAAMYTNRAHEAVRVFESVDPDGGWIQSWPAYWHNRLLARHRIGDFTGELNDVRAMQERYPETGRFPEERARIGLGEGVAVMRDVARRVEAGVPEPIPLRYVHELVLEVRKHGPADAIAVGDSVLSRALDLALAPDDDGGRRPSDWVLAQALYADGRYGHAEEVLLRLASSDSGGWHILGHLGMIAAGRGDRAGALHWDSAIAAIEMKAGEGEQTAWRAGIRAHLGDFPAAVRLLEQARAEGLFWHDRLYLLPHLAPLRGYPPFEAMMRPVDAPR